MLTALLIGAAFLVAMGLDVLLTTRRIDALLKEGTGAGNKATGRGNRE